MTTPSAPTRLTAWFSRRLPRYFAATAFHIWQATIVALANIVVLPPSWRAAALRPAGVRAERATLIYRDTVVQGPARLTIGAGTFLNRGCYLDIVADITIGRRVFIADHVRILTSSHEFGTHEQRASTLSGRPVVIGDGCWIGSGVVIMPGVRIGPGCIIGANALVTKDCEADGLYAGSPATLRRKLDRSP